MAYAKGNPKTKKALKDLVSSGARVGVFNPGPFNVNLEGRICIEGPHYPEPHKWYAECIVKDGIIISVK